jgi:hypothetical protein
MSVDVAKVPDPELQRFAEAPDSAGLRSVIVEIESGPPEFAPRDNVLRPRVPDGGRRGSSDGGSGGGSGESLESLERQLIALGLAANLVRLTAAQAFVVNVSPSQLCALSAMPLVGVIRPNRTHRVPHPF